MSNNAEIGCVMIGRLDIKGKDQLKRVYSTDGIAPTLVTCGGDSRK